MKINELRVPLWLKVAIPAMALILILGAASNWYFARLTERQMTDALKTRARTITRSLANECEYGLIAGNPTMLQRATANALGYLDVIAVTIYNDEGKLIVSAGQISRADATRRGPVLMKLLKKGSMDLYQPLSLDEPYRDSVLVWLRQETGPSWDEDMADQHPVTVQTLGAVELTVSPVRTRTAIDAMRHDGFWLVTAMVVAGMLACLVLARKAVSPLRSLMRGAEQVARGDLQTRVAMERNDEIGDLAGAFNAMTIALADSQHEILEYQDNLEKMVKEATVGLRESEERFRTFMDNSPALAFIKDNEGRYIYVNRRLREMNTAISGWLGRTDRELLPEAIAIHLREHDLEVVAAGQTQEFIETLPLADGRMHEWWVFKFPLHDAIGRTLVAGMGVDVTERRLLEEQLRQTQKMDAVGRLAGGVAHDFNNILTAILGYSELLLGRTTTPPTVRPQLEEIQDAARRAASLTRQLLAFSRKQTLQPQILDLNSSIAETEKMLRRLIGEHINLVTKLNADLWSVRADPAQVQQVLLNLAINARDAMSSGGQLTIATTNITLDNAYVASHRDGRAGDYACIIVTDTGAGMSAEVLEHLFEPFYTTKGPGKGTGLGLATCYGIVKQTGGHIDVTSRPGHGTEFRIYLPRTAEKPTTVTGTANLPVPIGTETILVAEDEPAVRELTATVLREFGYNILEAQNGRAAVELATEYGINRIDLLLSDVVMPVMGGKELAQRLRALRPDLKVLFVSGYAEDVISHEGILETGVSLLSKPYNPDALARKVREILDTPQPAGRNPEKTVASPHPQGAPTA